MRRMLAVAGPVGRPLPRRRLAAGALALALSAAAALAGGAAAPLPDLSQLGRREAEALLAQLAEVSVITSNCPGFAISDADWTLLNATGDMLAAQLGLDSATHVQRYFGRAFVLLDDPGACARIGPTARPLIARLTAMTAAPGS